MYQYEAAPAFWRSYRKLTPAQQQAAKQAWQILKRDPFDPRLGTHKIHSLSARAKETVHAVVIAADLHVIFVLRGSTVYTLDIGTHALSHTSFAAEMNCVFPQLPLDEKMKFIRIEKNAGLIAHAV